MSTLEVDPGIRGINVLLSGPHRPDEIRAVISRLDDIVYSRHRIAIAKSQDIRPADLDRVRKEALAATEAQTAGRNGHDEGQRPRATEDEATDLKNARQLVQQHRDHLRHCRGLSTWLVWDGARWKADETGEPERCAKGLVDDLIAEAVISGDAQRLRTAQRCAHSHRVMGMLRLAETEPEFAVSPGQLDVNAWALNVSNGTIDLRTGELRPHDPADLITKLAPVEYDPQAKAPLWEAFLHRVFGGDTALVEFAARMAGYGLTGDTREHVLFLLHGHGANGKSTYVETLRAAIGDYARTADFATFLAAKHHTPGGPRPDLVALVGARCVTAVEMEAGRRLDEALVKVATGGDTLSCRQLHGRMFEFRPAFKLTLVANHKPVVRSTGVAIWRRIRLVPFTVSIPVEEQDKDLGQKLLQELPGILAWAVRGCLDWANGGLQEPEGVLAATGTYRAEMDVVGPFIDECCDVADTVQSGARELYAAYTEWAASAGEPAISQTAFGIRLGERGFDSYKKGRKYWLGVSPR